MARPACGDVVLDGRGTVGGGAYDYYWDAGGGTADLRAFLRAQNGTVVGVPLGLLHGGALLFQVSVCLRNTGLCDFATRPAQVCDVHWGLGAARVACGQRAT